MRREMRDSHYDVEASEHHPLLDLSLQQHDALPDDRHNSKEKGSNDDAMYDRLVAAGMTPCFPRHFPVPTPPKKSTSNARSVTTWEPPHSRAFLVWYIEAADSSGRVHRITRSCTWFEWEATQLWVNGTPAFYLPLDRAGHVTPEAEVSLDAHVVKKSLPAYEKLRFTMDKGNKSNQIECTIVAIHRPGFCANGFEHHPRGDSVTLCLNEVSVDTGTKHFLLPNTWWARTRTNLPW
eukprot:TRINITY_DN3581_c0_g1_i2.p1 TRINITY_DN3581_c0_g1~~TRINITY_DN3581_c0_g1_i2.p1  ORF type:complete len:236 (-),score=17.26 TRINITY_DN3581_c0_g1_i2:624-1331(-)